MGLTPEQEKAVQELETPEERAAREERDRKDAGIGEDKPRRGRPPGVPNKPKISEESLSEGCKSLVRLVWFIASLPAWMADAKLTPLSDEEIEEGAAEAKAIVTRFPTLITVLMILGFPRWLVTSFVRHFERKPKGEKKTLELVQPPQESVKQ